jgi:hypothetical protein
VVGRTSDRQQPILNIRLQLMGSFRDEIDRQLDAAAAVVVISNADSQGSKFQGSASEPGLLLTQAEKASETDDGYLSALGITPLRLDAD